ncbi:MAG: DedA family protein [Dehalococcoidia bacterium]|nr:DedA family protein [Dehalococcoidia bacterium]
MTHLMEQVGSWIEGFIAALGYPGIVIVMAVENIFPPIPSEMVLPFAGSLSVKGELNFWGAVAAGTAGSLLGAVVLYAIGYVAREAGVRRLVAAYGRYVFISETDLDRGAAWFERYGEVVIFFGRLIPIIRSIISVPAGYTRMSAGRFLFYTTLGTALWSLFLTYVGRLLGENWVDIRGFMKPYENGTLIVLVLVVVVFVGWRALRWRRAPSAGARDRKG